MKNHPFQSLGGVKKKDPFLTFRMVSSRETIETLFDIVPLKEPTSIKMAQPPIDSLVMPKNLSIVVS